MIVRMQKSNRYRQHRKKITELPILIQKYQPDASYDLKGVDSDISKLDVEKALSDLKKDQVLQQYQFFVGDDAFASTEKLKQVREEENFWL